MYWDRNSLYPTVMVEKMPVKNFHWATQEHIDNILKLCKEGRYDEVPACTLSVDLKHDPKNFDKEKVFAMCPEFFEEDSVEKLCHTLFDKKDYVIHCRTFKYFLSKGMILENVNRVILYTEEAWMKSYIEFCVEQRTKADLEGYDFLVNFWKLMMNSVLGKTMENITKRINFELVNDTNRLQKLINKPIFQDISVHVPGSDGNDNNCLAGVHMTKPKILLNKPIYTGQCILDNSKRNMYEFVYDYCFP